VKVGDMIYHRDDPTMQRGYGLVVKLYETNSKAELVDIYWSGDQRVICNYLPHELRVINESR
jgi:hypothetical protein